jgi:hypothetical protein
MKMKKILLKLTNLIKFFYLIILMVKTNKRKPHLKKKKKTKKNSLYDITKLKFLNKDIIGEGVYSKVYKFRYSLKGIDQRYVVKKLKIRMLRKYFGKTANKSILMLFNNELRAIIYLSKYEICPKVYGIHSDISHNNLFYVLEKLDYTLGGMLRNGLFKPKHTDYFLDLLKKMIKTPYRHTDLHIENVMFHLKRKRFYLIDFGHYKKLTKESSNGFFYTERSSGEDYFLFDKEKDYSRAVMGTSGYSALSMVYKYLVYQILNNNKDADKYFVKLINFIKEFSSKNDYKLLIKELNKGVGVSKEEAIELKI